MIISLLAIWPPLALFATSVTVASIEAPLFLRAAAVGGIIILIFDIAARMRDFRRVANRLQAEPDSLDRHILRYKPSWCQRTVVYWAAEEALGREGRSYVGEQFQSMGYRWYHFFPDRTFTRESPFLKPKFWRSLIGGTPEVRQGFRNPAE